MLSKQQKHCLAAQRIAAASVVLSKHDIDAQLALGIMLGRLCDAKAFDIVSACGKHLAGKESDYPLSVDAKFFLEGNKVLRPDSVKSMVEFLEQTVLSTPEAKTLGVVVGLVRKQVDETQTPSSMIAGDAMEFEMVEAGTGDGECVAPSGHSTVSLAMRPKTRSRCN